MFVTVETFLNCGENSNAIYRVRPVEDQIFPSTMRIQCSRSMRTAFPLGTRFRLPVEVVTPSEQTQFLREIGRGDWSLYKL